LERAISFEKGFSFTSSFTVAYAGYYSILAVFPRSKGAGAAEGIEKQLPVTFTVNCDGVIVAQGDSPHPDSIYSAKEDDRIMARFHAEPGKRYNISYLSAGARPDLDATKPTLRIRRYAESNLRNLFAWTWIARDIALIGLLFAVSPIGFLARKHFRHTTRSHYEASSVKETARNLIPTVILLSSAISTGSPPAMHRWWTC
jgi:hypothetical protein